MQSKELHITTLLDIGTCVEQLEQFKRLFGDKVQITKEVCVKHGGKFSLDWAAGKLFSPSTLRDYRAGLKAANDLYTVEIRAEAMSKRTGVIHVDKSRAADNYRRRIRELFAECYINDVPEPQENQHGDQRIGTQSGRT